MTSVTYNTDTEWLIVWLLSLSMTQWVTHCVIFTTQALTQWLLTLSKTHWVTFLTRWLTECFLVPSESLSDFWRSEPHGVTSGTQLVTQWFIEWLFQRIKTYWVINWVDFVTQCDSLIDFWRSVTHGVTFATQYASLSDSLSDFGHSVWLTELLIVWLLSISDSRID